MKRLFYLASNIDHVAEIIYSIEAEGISDKQFFVLSRDERAVRRRFLHGGNSLENTRIVAASSRSNIFGAMAIGLFTIIAFIALPLDEVFSATFFVISLLIFILVKAAVLIAGGMYDDYFKGVFNNNLDKGSIIVVVDVNRKQARFVMELFNKYESVCLLVDASNFASPLPNRKYIKRQTITRLS